MAMDRRLLVPLCLLVFGCAHSAVGELPAGNADERASAVEPTSRERLAQALRERGFLAPDAPKGTQLRGPIRQFQKSQGLAVTGFPDRETLSRLGIDPATVDSSLDPAPEIREGATSAGVSH
jgi:Putative peptidoglycan binding domain